MKLTEEQSKIIEDNHNLIYGYCKAKNIDPEEYYGDLAINLCKSVQTYDEKKGKLSTYVYNNFNKILLTIYKKNKLYSGYKIVNIEDFKNNIKYEDNIDFKEYECSNLFRNKKIPQLLSMNYSQTEISKILGINQCNISREINRVKTKMSKI